MPTRTTSHCGYALRSTNNVFVTTSASNTPSRRRVHRRQSKKNHLRRILRPRPASLVQSKPQLLAWLTCDGVHIDPGSGKHTILGVFSNIQARQFPVTHPFMIWFLTISDCAAGRAQAAHLDGPRCHAIRSRCSSAPFESQSPLHRINLINEIRNLSFPQPGDYSLLIEIDEEPLLATNLTVST